MTMEAAIERTAVCRPSQHPLNQQLVNLHKRMKVHHSHVDRVCFVLYDTRDHLLKTYADSAGLALSIAHDEVPISSLPALKQCIETRGYAVLSDLHCLRTSALIESLLNEGYQSSLVIPTFSSTQFRGFIFLISLDKNAFYEHDFAQLKPYLEMLQSAILSEFELVNELVEKAHRLVARSPVYQRESYAHKQRVADYTNRIALGLADQYDFDDEWVEHLTLFAQFHDIGKVMLPAELLCKQSPLTSQELILLQSHIFQGESLLEQLALELGEAQHPSIELFHDIIAYHYEFLDGSGYPRQLRAEEIPISARIVCVANIFDALTSHKPYKQAWSIPYALLELEKMVGEGKLDCDCVNVLREHQHLLKAIIARYPERDPKDGCY